MVLRCRTCRGFTPIQPDKNARLVQRMPGHTIGPLRLTVGSKIFFFADVHDISILGVVLSRILLFLQAVLSLLKPVVRKEVHSRKH